MFTHRVKLTLSFLLYVQNSSCRFTVCILTVFGFLVGVDGFDVGLASCRSRLALHFLLVVTV